MLTSIRMCLRPRAALFFLVIAVAFAVPLALPASTSAVLNIKWWTWSNSGCTNRVDPVTVILYNGTADSAQTHINHHTGWGSVWFGSPQYFYGNGSCELNAHESASAVFFQTRYHVRIKQCEEVGLPGYPSCDSTDALDPFSLASPHLEDIQTCGHAVRETVNGISGYDLGRKALYDSMNGPHYTYMRSLGNSGSIVQCDGGIAGSSGTVRFIKVN